VHFSVAKSETRALHVITAHVAVFRRSDGFLNLKNIINFNN